MTVSPIFSGAVGDILWWKASNYFPVPGLEDEGPSGNGGNSQMSDSRLDDFSRRMDGALEALRKEFAGLRTGRASVNLLDSVQVEAYGGNMHHTKKTTKTMPEARLITVQVWDKGLVKAVDKAIRKSKLGLNPQQDGAVIRVPIPELTQERRLELAKVAG